MQRKFQIIVLDDVGIIGSLSYFAASQCMRTLTCSRKASKSDYFFLLKAPTSSALSRLKILWLCGGIPTTWLFIEDGICIWWSIDEDMVLFACRGLVYIAKRTWRKEETKKTCDQLISRYDHRWYKSPSISCASIDNLVENKTFTLFISWTLFCNNSMQVVKIGASEEVFYFIKNSLIGSNE